MNYNKPIEMIFVMKIISIILARGWNWIYINWWL